MVRSLRDYAADFGLPETISLLSQKVLRRDVYEMSLPNVRSRVYFRRNTIDLVVLRQIFKSGEFDFPMGKSPRTIIDGGANVGYSTLYFANRFPSATIVSVEPESSNCELFAKNCAGYSNVQLVQGAIWPREAYLTIKNRGVCNDAFQVMEAAQPTSDAIRAYNIPSLMAIAKTSRVDILKLDIEGAEKELFKEGSAEWLDRVGVLLIECHDRLVPGCLDAVLEVLRPRAKSHQVRGEYQVFQLDEQ